MIRTSVSFLLLSVYWRVTPVFVLVTIIVETESDGKYTMGSPVLVTTALEGNLLYFAWACSNLLINLTYLH